MTIAVTFLPRTAPSPLPPIAFIGGGNMASAIIGGLIQQGAPADAFEVVEPFEEARTTLAQSFGIVAKADGRDIAIGPGQSLFIKRGVVHGFTNQTQAPATCLCVLTPGVLGPAYFREIAGLLAAGAPDPAKMKEVMLRYGLIPAPPAA